ncbi:MAG: hypothetical protein M3P06_20650 [Acidobacteriota bacterium]|nr:hypothetical protein [Acidobacteriota bacterium]
MSDTSALYEPLIERDLAAIPAAARAFAAEHSADELWIAVTRFAVMAYAPSQHAKRAVMACRAAHDVREELGERWIDMIVECARYAAESRLPWSEPPILDPPHVEAGQPRDVAELRAAIAANDRHRAERWLAARLEDAHEDLRAVAKGDALLMLDTAIALEALLGEKGRYALLRMVIAELLIESEDVDEPIETLIDQAIAENGSIDSVRNVFVRNAGVSPAGPAASRRRGLALSMPLIPYPLARDYAQTLIAHSIAHKLPARERELLAAVHHNLEHGESFAEWSFA